MARSRLRRFQQGSLLAVAITSFLFLFWEAQVSGATEPNPTESVEQATSTIRELGVGFYAFLPKILIAAAILTIGWLLARAIQIIATKYASRQNEKRKNISVLFRMAVFLITFTAAISVLVGDMRALLGSLGLLGLALSWALQAPIESFTGWILNTFRDYYRPGDRIEVGEAVGDVYRIDLLTTTVWEIGGPGKPVTGAQPTGALITFPNSEILRSNVINYSRDFPYIWDEVTFSVANESDLPYAVGVFRKLAQEILGQEMRVSAREYETLLRRQGLSYTVSQEPEVYLSLAESYTNCTVRYLVRIRSRRRVASSLIEKISEELKAPQHKKRITSAYPRSEVVLQMSGKFPAEKKADTPFSGTG